MKKIIICVVAALSTASCGVWKTYSTPDTTGIVEESPSALDTVPSAMSRRQLFADPALQRLIDTALVRNADLGKASLSVRQAAATLGAARLAYLPGISISPQGSVSSFGGEAALKTYTIPVGLDLEIDLSGRITANKRAAGATLGKAESNARAVRSRLIASVARTYYTLAMLDGQIAVSENSLKSWNEIIRVLEAQKRVGDATDAGIAQALGSKYSVEASLATLRHTRKSNENTLCALVGIPLQEIECSGFGTIELPKSLSKGVSLSLLAGRPDVREAEYALEETFYSVEVARGAFYPSLTLSGTAGWTNNSGAAIVNPGNWLLNALGQLTQPLFNRGRNIANLKIAKASYEQALLTFRQSLLDAGVEVNTALSHRQAATERREVTALRVAALEKAVEATRLLMQHSGDATYLEVIAAQQALLNAELERVENNYELADSAIELYTALGCDD